jgi:hypothetical protein
MSKLIQYRGAVYREALLGRTNLNPDRFVLDLIVPDKLAAADFRNEDVDAPEPLTWSLDEHNFLNSYIVHVDTSRSPPRTADMVHTSVVHHYGSHPFDEYVRGNVYSRGNKEIEIYGWEPQYGLDSSTTRNMSFDGQFALKELLKRLLPGWKFLVHDF